MNWPEAVEKIRRDHNGVFSVELFFGHDGHNACSFWNYETELAKGESGRSMEEAVGRCLKAWEDKAALNRAAHQAEVDKRLLTWEVENARYQS